MADTIDARSGKLDATVRVYDSFYEFDTVVDGNEYDIVYSYFKNTCANVTVASNFTSFLFRIANTLGKPVLEILDSMKGTTSSETNAIIAYYLNSFKSKTSLYGISIVPKPNQTVQRNIVV
jgi:hypothetical protein